MPAPSREPTPSTLPGPAGQGEPRPLRAVIEDYANHCFLDTDGVTRDAARMLAIIDSWRAHQSDQQAGVRRNTAFDPNLPVVVVVDTQIRHAPGTEHEGQPAVLFTMVPRDLGSTAQEAGTTVTG